MLGTIVVGALVILSRLKLLAVQVGFWATFAAALGVLALSGHAMSANWHLGPVSDGYFWRVLIFSPEVFIFLSFMITDPRTVPGHAPGAPASTRSASACSAALLIAPQTTEFQSKVALLGSLTIVCAARPLLILLRERLPARLARASWRGWPPLLALRSAHCPEAAPGRGVVTLASMAAFAGLIVLAGSPARSSAGIARHGQAVCRRPASGHGRVVVGRGRDQSTHGDADRRASWSPMFAA